MGVVKRISDSQARWLVGAAIAFYVILFLLSLWADAQRGQAIQRENDRYRMERDY